MWNGFVSRETFPSPNSQRRAVTAPVEVSVNWILNPFVAAGAQVKAAAGGEP